MSIKTVAVQGATGNLGPSVVNALIDAGFTVIALSRSSTHPPQLHKAATVKQVNLEDPSSLKAALQGADAFVSIVGNAGFSQQASLIDAAIAAGVKFFIPSEFGSDTSNPKAATLPVFGPKIETQKYLIERKDKIGHAFINNGAFLDWGVSADFLINTSGGTTQVFNGGDVPCSTTLIADVGKAVAGVLGAPDRYNGKFVRVHSATVTQNQLVAAAEKAGVRINKVATTTEEAYAAGMETLKSGKGDIGAAMVGFIYVGAFDPSYGMAFETTDNQDLGIKTLSAEEVEAVVAKAVAGKK